MVVELGNLAIGIFLIVFGLIIAGFLIYLFKNYCQARLKNNRRISADQRRQLDPMKSVLANDEDSVIKLHTMEQILKQEEKSALNQGKSVNLVALKFQKPETTSNKGPKSPGKDQSKITKGESSKDTY